MAGVWDKAGPLIACAAVIGAAYMFRYDPMPIGMASPQKVWDRWAQRECVVVPGSAPACTREEMEALFDEVNELNTLGERLRYLKP